MELWHWCISGRLDALNLTFDWIGMPIVPRRVDAGALFRAIWRDPFDLSDLGPPECRLRSYTDSGKVQTCRLDSRASLMNVPQFADTRMLSGYGEIGNVWTLSDTI